MQESINDTKKENNFSTRVEQSGNNYLVAYLILVLSLLLFLATVSGITNGLSKKVDSILLSNLGYTNKWSKSFGSRWFIFVNDDISALAGPVLLPIFTLLISGYVYLKRRFKVIRKFLFVVIGGAILMMITKVFFATDLSNQSVDIIYNTISPFPSGHAMLGTIVYISLAVVISRTQRRPGVKKFLIASSIFLALLIGISRFITGGHTLTEVLAGWSLGMIWLTVYWLLEQFKRKKGWL